MMNKLANLNPNLFSRAVEQVPTRNGYGNGLLELGEKNKNVVVLTGDLAESTRVLSFWKKYPDRFVECGVAEQNMAGIAAGLALNGKIPFISSYAVFSPGRSWDQVRVSICLNKANVKIAGAHAGISVGPDGATHQALEDIAIMRVLPHMKIIIPCDYEETKKATLVAASLGGPVYFRFAREKTPIITTPKTPFVFGRAEIFRKGKDISIIACGPLVYQSLIAAEELSGQGIDCEVINNHTIKPLDEKTLLASARKTKAVVTVEEHQIMAGAGSAICELFAKKFPVPVEMIGMQDSYGESGTPTELLEKYGMSVKTIKTTAKKVLIRK
ncbi:transketolase family protein [Candidatus Uhrbacteria bacterium]|nr:transketolase family protein [Candidatus Uhrbacteria bacterium]